MPRSAKKPKSITGTARTPSLKPQKTRQLIRRFHILQKKKFSLLEKLSLALNKDINESNYASALTSHEELAKAYTAQREAMARTLRLSVFPSLDIEDSADLQKLCEALGSIDGEEQRRGGLKTYQAASTWGQEGKRGGDSSRRLMEWLPKTPDGKLRALEIGCLSSQNLISTSKYFEKVVRIDLRSQEPGLIEQQDFMERPMPDSDADRFNVVSCSLVLNFVPSSSQRFEMLRRMKRFLLPDGLVFIVLPLPCVSNSRYFDNSVFDEIMDSLGFVKENYHEAKKVAYWLWKWQHAEKRTKFSKKELHGGSKRNNFCMTNS